MLDRLCLARTFFALAGSISQMATRVVLGSCEVTFTCQSPTRPVPTTAQRQCLDIETTPCDAFEFKGRVAERTGLEILNGSEDFISRKGFVYQNRSFDDLPRGAAGGNKENPRMRFSRLVHADEVRILGENSASFCMGPLQVFLIRGSGQTGLTECHHIHTMASKPVNDSGADVLIRMNTDFARHLTSFFLTFILAATGIACASLQRKRK